MATLFTKIINGDVPSYNVAEDDNCIAFLDINPNSKGHTLCVPKTEVDKIFDLDESTYLNLMVFSRKVALAIRETIACKRVGMSVIGLEVPHVHVHLIPLQDMKDAQFANKVTFTEAEFKTIATQIQTAFNNL